MFVFGNAEGFLEQPKGVIFSCPNETLARIYHKGVKEWGIYKLEADLSVAYLIEGGGPDFIKPTEDEKLKLWSGYVYKSLLAWAPYPEDILI